MTTWVFMAMLYAGDHPHWAKGDPYNTSDQCFAIAQAATRKLMEQRLGWATCLPPDIAEGLIAKQRQK